MVEFVDSALCNIQTVVEFFSIAFNKHRYPIARITTLLSFRYLLFQLTHILFVVFETPNETKQPLRIIVDGQGRTPLTARVFSESGRTLVVLNRPATLEAARAFAQAGAEVLELPSEEEFVDLERLLKALGEQQITSVLVEGGGILFGSLFDHGLVDKVIAFIAPLIIGGGEARTAVAGSGIDRLADCLKLKHVRVEKCGEDLAVSGYVKE